MSIAIRGLIYLLLVISFVVVSLGQVKTCPEIEIVFPSALTNPEETVTIAAKLLNRAQGQELSYSWTVSDGKIVSGQGTSAIRVLTTEEAAGKNMKIGLSVLGLPTECNTSAEGFMSIASYPIGEPVIALGKVKPNQLRTQLDSYFVELMNHSDSEGLVEFIFDRRDNRRYKIAQLNLIIGQMDFRKLARSRVSIAVAESNFQQAVLWLIPPGAKFPESYVGGNSRITDKSHKIIKAEDLERKLGTLFTDK